MRAPQVREFASTVAKCKAARRARTARALMKHDSKHPVHEHEALLLCAESKWGKKKIKKMHVAKRDLKPV